MWGPKGRGPGKKTRGRKKNGGGTRHTCRSTEPAAHPELLLCVTGKSKLADSGLKRSKSCVMNISSELWTSIQWTEACGHVLGGVGHY